MCIDINELNHLFENFVCFNFIILPQRFKGDVKSIINFGQPYNLKN